MPSIPVSLEPSTRPPRNVRTNVRHFSASDVSASETMMPTPGQSSQPLGPSV